MKQPLPFANCHECGWYRADCPCGCHACCAHPKFPKSFQSQVTAFGTPKKCPLQDTEYMGVRFIDGKQYDVYEYHVLLEWKDPTP